MFYPTRDLKTIYSKDHTVSVEHILECMNITDKQLQIYSNHLRNKYTEATIEKLNNQKKNPQDIQAYVSSENFHYKAANHVECMITHHIIQHLSDNKHIGMHKTKILTNCIKHLENARQNMIRQGLYKISLLDEFNKIMQNTSNEEFQSLIEIIIACSHLKTDLTEQQQKTLEGAIIAYNKTTETLSLQSLRNFTEDMTGIDMLNPISSIKKKLGINKPEGTKQPLGSMDEKVINIITSPYNCSYFVLGALTFGLGGLAGPLLPFLIITTVGKSLYSMVTEDKDKEGTIHNPFQEGVTKQPRTTERPQNYTAILEQHRKDAGEQQNTDKTQASK